MPETKKRRPRQGRIPGTEPESFPEIDQAADEYVTTRDQRMTLLQEEIRLQEHLLLLMHKHKVKVYEYGDYNVVLDAGPEKVKVKKKKAPEENNDEE